MRERTFFALVLLLLFGTMASWSHRLENRLARVQVSSEGRRATATVAEPISRAQSRRDLLEVLDRLVAYEHYYHSVYGHFTKLIHRTGFVIPSQILANYAVHVSEASDDRLVAFGTSELEGRTVDVVSVDQDFRVQANFPLPAPRADFLKAQAVRHLRQLREAPQGQLIEEQGIFRGFFKYEVRKDSQDRRVAFAVGLRAPVLGMQLEGSSGMAALNLEDTQPGKAVSATGQSSAGEVMSGTEQAYLAQRIFQGEVGRYARDLHELSRITHFSFQEESAPSQGRSSEDAGLSWGRLSIESVDESKRRSPAQAEGEAPTQHLEIEALDSVTAAASGKR